MMYWFIHQKKHLNWKCFQLVTFAVDIIGTWENLPVNKNKWPWSSFCPNQINRERKTRKFLAIPSSIYQIEKLFSFNIQIFPHNVENELNYSFCIKWFHLLHWNWWVQNEVLPGEICNKYYSLNCMEKKEDENFSWNLTLVFLFLLEVLLSSKPSTYTGPV